MNKRDSVLIECRGKAIDLIIGVVYASRGIAPGCFRVHRDQDVIPNLRLASPMGLLPISTFYRCLPQFIGNEASITFYGISVYNRYSPSQKTFDSLLHAINLGDCQFMVCNGRRGLNAPNCRILHPCMSPAPSESCGKRECFITQSSAELDLEVQT